MKNTFLNKFTKVLSFSIFLGASSAMAQNVFPATGKVGLGTSAPAQNLELKQNNAAGAFRLSWGSSYPSLFTEFGYPAAGGFVLNAKANGSWARFHFKCDDVEKFLIHKDYLSASVPFRGDLAVDQNGANGGLKLGWGGQYPSLFTEFGYPAAGGFVINARANGSWARVHFKLDGVEKMQINKDYVSVDGLFIAEEIQVKNVGADYVFDDSYKLRSINEVEQFINTNKHLPDVAPASETEKGINVGEFNETLLRKIEELTLYIIQINKEVEALKAENIELKK